MLNNRRGTVTIFILLIMMFFTATGVFGSGAQEDRMAEAELLVEQREYNSALKLLTEMLKDNPDKIDEVQDLLLKIRDEKEHYNDRYEELIDTYGGDDVEAAYPIIKELEELDPNPNESTRISLVLARETAGFVFNNNRWVDIMETCADLLEQKEYASAVENYMNGFDLSRDIFMDAGYGNIIINEIFARSDAMNEMSLEFIDLYPQMKVKNDRISTAFNARNLSAWLTDVPDAYTELQRAAELREELKDAADYFIIQEDIIRKAQGDDKQVHYLIYMDRLLNGRTSVEELEGITGAIELFWNESFQKIEADTVTFADELFNSAHNLYKSGSYIEAEAAFTNVISSAESGIETLEMGTEYLESDAEYAREGLLYMDGDKLESDLAYMRSLLTVSQTFFTVIEKNERLAVLGNGIDSINVQSDGFRTDGIQLREDIAAEAAVLDALLAEWLQNAENVGEGELDGRSLSAVGIPVAEYRKMTEQILQSEILLAAKLAEIELGILDLEYAAVEAAVQESSALIQGIADENAAAAEEGDFEVLYKYPDQALQQLLATERRVTALTVSIADVEQVINSERAEIKQGAEVRAASAHAAELAAASSVLLTQAEKLGGSAREQIFTAEKLKQEGERRIEDAKRFTSQARFAAAKERLEQAAAKFDESLSYLEDPILRTFRDNEIPRLYEEIQVAENNLVVRQVREFLTEGKASYSQGNFPAAQSVLIKAQSRWSDTNVEPNSEVEYWLTLTQTALSVTSGRIIAATDPLFAEMNQYMNQAYADFQSARDEYDSGRRSDADDYFSRAEQSLLYVQQFFPFNEEARVLNLRISQYRDPERFNELFRSDFQTARRLISSNPQKAYIDLKDLEAIDANYAGLQAAITEAEYAAGIKVRPPDPAKLRQSAELYDLAYSIVSRNIRSEFNVALSYLDESISLNPDNSEAIRLKDRIATDVGGTTVAVMSNTDQQMYEEAVSEFTAGNYLKARILVENLMKKADNQRNPKLIDLQERIERTR